MMPEASMTTNTNTLSTDAAIPGGHVLVPVQPTEAMTVAGGSAALEHATGDAEAFVANVWSAMLAASPPPPIGHGEREAKWPAIRARPGETHVDAAKRVIVEVQVDPLARLRSIVELWRALHVQSIGAAISNSDMHAVERAYSRLRDAMDAEIIEGRKS